MPDLRTGFLKLKKFFGRLGSGESHTITVEPSRASFIEMEDANFHHDSAVLMPEDPTTSAGDTAAETPAQARVAGLDVIAACLREVERNPKKLVLVAGHTDTSGDAGYNVELSELRAKNLHAALKGNRDDWVAVADKKHKVEDYKQILKWVKQTKGWPCDPGKVDNNNDAATKTAVKNFQIEYNKAFKKSIAEDGIVGKETWGAFFDVYEEQLLGRMNIEPQKLKQVRDSIVFADGGKPFVGCGESFPVDQAGKDNVKSEANRRVEVLFFEEDEKPKLECHPGPKQCKRDLCDIYNPARLKRTPIPVPPSPKPGPITIEVKKIETTDPSPPKGGPPFHGDDDLCPLLGEKAKFHVEIAHLKDGFSGKVRMEIGRLTDTADDPATPDVNESFALIAAVEKEITAGPDPVKVELEWDGKAAFDLPEQFSSRKTPDNRAGKDQNIPMLKAEKGKPVRHGLYHVGSVAVLKDGGTTARRRFDDVAVSVPLVLNVTFNADWPASLKSFGLAAFQTSLEEALRRHVGRDYMVRAGTLGDRMNVRVITDPAKKNTDTIFVTIGGSDPDGSGLFGVSAFVSASLQENLYAMHEVLQHPTLNQVKVFPNTFLFFNNNSMGAGDQAAFRAAFAPLGVRPAQTDDAPGTATARTVAAGVVTGATDGTDAANVNVSLNADGVATVVTKDTAKVPPARTADIQRAFNAFVKFVGNTTSHEGGHALGIAAPNNAGNELTIGGTKLRTPLPDDASFHNPVALRANTNIMDAGPTRPFLRRIEGSGFGQQVFMARNLRYLRDCIPFAPKDL
jgi:hypothetical protein